MAAFARASIAAGLGGSAHRGQGVAAEPVRSGRSLEDAELDQEPQPDADADEIADPAERVRRIRRAGKAERLQQARDENRNQAIERGLPRLVAILEPLRRNRIPRIEQSEG